MTSLVKKIVAKVTTLIINEYKFHVDFKGMLYFEDTKQYIYPNAIKDKKFISQLYQNLTPTKFHFHNKIQQKSQLNPQPHQQITSLQAQLNRNINYPFVAEFWGERNFVNCGIAPIIFSRIIKTHQLQNPQLSDTDKQRQFLEFSLGQYSLFDPKELCIDDSGHLWHPYLKTKLEKPTKTIKPHEAKILGVLSNELLAELLDKIKLENGQSYLEHNDEKIKIGKKL